MAWKKMVTLKDGRKALLRDISRKDSAKEMRAFIGQFVREGAYLSMDKVPRLAEERSWLKGVRKAEAKGTIIYVVAESGGKHVGSVEAKKGAYKEKYNVCLGITIAKPFRAAGLGRIMLTELIGRARKEMKPKNIWLSVHAPNKPAQALYKKLGFKEVGRFPKWVLHKGKYIDKLDLVLKK